MDKITYRPNRPQKKIEDVAVIRGLLDHFFVKFLLLGLSAFLVYNVVNAVGITIKKVKILEDARTEVENLRVTNLQLASLLEEIQTVEYLEVEARDRLNFSGNKETVFVIPGKLLESAQERIDIILGKGVVKEKPSVEKWIGFVTSGV